MLSAVFTLLNVHTCDVKVTWSKSKHFRRMTHEAAFKTVFPAKKSTKRYSKHIVSVSMCYLRHLDGISYFKLSGNARTKELFQNKQTWTNWELLNISHVPRYIIDKKQYMYFQHSNSCACSAENEKLWRSHYHNWIGDMFSSVDRGWWLHPSVNSWRWAFICASNIS